MKEAVQFRERPLLELTRKEKGRQSDGPNLTNEMVVSVERIQN